jgi:hypothetical protein
MPFYVQGSKEWNEIVRPIEVDKKLDLLGEQLHLLSDKVRDLEDQCPDNTAQDIPADYAIARFCVGVIVDRCCLGCYRCFARRPRLRFVLSLLNFLSMLITLIYVLHKK